MKTTAAMNHQDFLLGFDGEDGFMGSMFSRAGRFARGRVHEHAGHIRKGTHIGASLHRKPTHFAATLHRKHGALSSKAKHAVQNRMHSMGLLGADSAQPSTASTIFGHIGSGLTSAFTGVTTILDKGAAYVPAATAYFQSKTPNLMPTSMTDKHDDKESSSIPWMPIGIGAGVLLLVGGVFLARK